MAVLTRKLTHHAVLPYYHNPLPQPTTTTHYHNPLPQPTTTTHYHNPLPQPTTTTHYPYSITIHRLSAGFLSEHCYNSMLGLRVSLELPQVGCTIKHAVSLLKYNLMSHDSHVVIPIRASSFAPCHHIAIILRGGSNISLKGGGGWLWTSGDILYYFLDPLPLFDGQRQTIISVCNENSGCFPISSSESQAHPSANKNERVTTFFIFFWMGNENIQISATALSCGLSPRPPPPPHTHTQTLDP